MLGNFPVKPTHPGRNACSVPDMGLTTEELADNELLQTVFDVYCFQAVIWLVKFHCRRTILANKKKEVYHVPPA